MITPEQEAMLKKLEGRTMHQVSMEFERDMNNLKHAEAEAKRASQIKVPVRAPAAPVPEGR
jgi:hypothetical protein